MTSRYYVATDFEGREHTAHGVVRWPIPPENEASVEAPGPVALKSPERLLDGLDARILRAIPIGDVDDHGDGTIVAAAARLTRTSWGPEVAARFALSCAEHILGDHGAAPLADGTTLAQAIADARAALDDVTSSGAARGGYLERLRTYRHARHDRDELQEMSLGLASEDGQKGVYIGDDPAYDLIAPVIDAVVGAIELALSHLEPHPLATVAERREAHEEHEAEDRATPMRLPTLEPLPFGLGVAEFGGSPIGSAEDMSSSMSATETARHAVRAQEVRVGPDAGKIERAWQAAQLDALLEPSEADSSTGPGVETNR